MRALVTNAHRNWFGAIQTGWLIHRSTTRRRPLTNMKENVMNLMSCYLAARSLCADRKGVTALEYGLIASLIAVAIITGVALVGTNAAAVFEGIAGRLVAPT